MQRRFNVIQDSTGRALSNGVVSVFTASGALATLYSDNGVTPTGNPVSTNSQGEYSYYAANGTYTEQLAATGFVAETQPGVLLFDPADAADGVVKIDDFSPAADGITYDTAAFTAAFAALGAKGGIVRLNASKSYHLPSGFAVPDYVTIQGALPLADQARGVAAGNFAALGSRLLLDSMQITVTVNGAGGVTSSNLVPVSNSLTTVKKNMVVEGSGIYPGTFINGTSTPTASIVLNVNPAATIAPGTVLTLHSADLTLGNASMLERVTVMAYATPATPFASQAIYNTEVTAWKSRGTGVVMEGYGSQLKDVSVFGFFLGVSIPRGDRQRITGLIIDNWNGLLEGPVGDLPHITGIHAWPFMGAGITAYTPTPYDGYRGGYGVYAYLANDVKVLDSFVYNYQTRVWIKDSQRVSLIGTDADGAPSLTDNIGTPITTTGIYWDGGSIDGVCMSCQSSSATDAFLVNLVAADGVTPLTYGALSIVDGKAFSSTNDYHVVNGGLTIDSSSARTGVPVVADVGTTYLQINDLSANGGVGNLVTYDASVITNIGKRGGQITGYTDNIGETVRGVNLLTQGAKINFGSVALGPQFVVDPTIGAVANPSTIPSAWGTNGGGHFGSTGITYVHSDTSGAVKPIAFYIGKNNYAGQWTTVGPMYTVGAGLTATGANQAAALALTNNINTVTTTAAGTGVSLPVHNTNQTAFGNFSGLEVTVFNKGANALSVYPPVGASATILDTGATSGTTNAAVSVASGASAKFVCVSSTQWMRL